MSIVLWSLLVVLAMPSSAFAETLVYFLGHPSEVPAPLLLFLGGLALVGVGMTLRKWVQRPEMPPIEPIEAPPLGRLSELPAQSAEVPQESAEVSQESARP